MKIIGVGQVQSKIASLEFLDAFVADDGQPLRDAAGPPVEQVVPHAERTTAPNNMALPIKDFALLSNSVQQQSFLETILMDDRICSGAEYAAKV